MTKWQVRIRGDYYMVDKRESRLIDLFENLW